jgi:uncharacterized paraquat-inducible protein A
MHSTIRVRCPGCNARIKAPFEMLGQTRSCPRCSRRLVIKTKGPDDAEPMLSGSTLLDKSRLIGAS